MRKMPPGKPRKPRNSTSQMRILNRVMLVPKLFFVFPFNSNHGKVRTSYWLMIISMVIIFLSIISTVWQVFYGTAQGRTGWSVMSTKISRGADIILGFYAMASIITYAIKIRELNKFILKLSEARHYLAGVGYSKKITVSYRILWFDAFLFSVILGLTQWSNIYTIATTINFVFIYATGTALIFMYCSFMDIIGKQLAFLNDKTQFLVGQRYFKEKTVQLARFSDVHHAFCSAAEALQESHGYPLAILFLSFFIKILVLTRSLISNVMTQQIDGTVFSLPCLLASVVVKLCLVVRNAAFTSAETKRFNQLLLENVVIEPHQEDWNMKLDVHMALNREVDLSAAGFFILDYPVLHSMVAMITSFMVVMIQTDKPPAQ